jgi:hypothetical protein
MNRIKTRAAVAAALSLTMAGVAGAAPPDPLAATLIALEKQSWVAWQGHDGKFFDGFLSDDHVEMTPGGPTGKAVVVAGVAGGGCTVASYTVDHFTVTRLAPDTALLTYRAEQDTACGAAKVPSPVWATSLFVRKAGHWRNALYVHTTIPQRAPAKPG